MSSTQYNHQHCLHTFPIYVVNNQLQLCIHLCSDDAKRQRQQCWYRPLIQIVYPKEVLSHMPTTSNQMGRDLECRKIVPPPPSPIIVLDFAHHDSDEVLHCPGAKWHHTQALQEVYSAEKASNILQTCRVILDADCSNNWHEMVNTSPFQLKNMTCMTSKAPQLLRTLFFLGCIRASHSAFCCFIWGSNDCIHDSSTVKMRSRNALPSFLQHYRRAVARTCMAVWLSLSTCGIHFAQTFLLPKLLVRIQ